MTADSPVPNLERHPLSALFGNMDDASYQELVESIAKNGQREAILLTEDNYVIDGWHRYRAAKDAGVDPWFDTYDEERDGELAGYVIDMNLKRRHLNAMDRARIEVEVREWRPHGITSNVDDNTFTTQQMAQEAGVSERTIKRAKAEKRASEGDETYQSEYDEPYGESDDDDDGEPAAVAEEPRLTPTERLEVEVNALKADLLSITNERDDLRNENSALRRAGETENWQEEFDRLQENYRAERSQRESLQERVNELSTRNQQLENFVQGLRVIARRNDMTTLQQRLLD